MEQFKIENQSENKEKIIAEFEDLRGKDLSREDLSQVSTDILTTAQFDTETIWPNIEKLPAGFNPEKFLEEGKNPGLGIKELHQQGIDGRGVVVAIIDHKLDIDHPEYRDSLIDCKEYGPAEEEPISMHGPAVASLLVGKDCGVALGAKLCYYAVPSHSGKRDFTYNTKALIDIIENNKNLASDKKVRVVSCSIGYRVDVSETGLDEYAKALQLAKDSGIFVVDVLGDKVGVNFSGGGSPEDKDNFESYSYWLSKRGQEREILLSQSPDKIFQIIRRDGLEASLTDSALRDKISAKLKAREREIIIPSDYRTVASSSRKRNQFFYEGKGGLSWSVPYLAGIFALALQVNPSIKQEEIAEIIDKTAIINTKGLRIINRKGIIEAVQNNQ